MKERRMAYSPPTSELTSPSLVPCQNKRRELEQYLTLSCPSSRRPKNDVSDLSDGLEKHLDCSLPKL